MKILIGGRARRQVERASSWWHENAEYPSLFDQEFEAALHRLPRTPNGAVSYPTAKRPHLMRLLLPKTEYHIYFSVEHGETRVVIHAVWGVVEAVPRSCSRQSYSESEVVLEGEVHDAVGAPGRILQGYEVVEGGAEHLRARRRDLFGRNVRTRETHAVIAIAAASAAKTALLPRPAPQRASLVKLKLDQIHGEHQRVGLPVCGGGAAEWWHGAA